VASNVRRLGLPGGVSEAELARAKILLKSSLMQQLTTFAFVAEDIGRQVLCRWLLWDLLLGRWGGEGSGE
jgi:predicted Zn-dependent peptidase